MRLDSWLELLPYLASAAVSATVAVYAARRARSGRVPGARSFSGAASAQAAWTLGYAVEVSTPTLAGKVFWDDLQFIAAAAWFLSFFSFAVAYTGRTSAFLRWLGVANWIFCGAYLALVYTDSLHGLIRPTVELVTGEDGVALTYPFTPVGWPVFVEVLCGFGVALWLLARHAAHARSWHRAQAAIIIAGTLVPLGGMILTVADLAPAFHRDMSPFTFAVSNLVIGWGLFRYRLFELVPVARELVIEQLADGVIMLDAEDRLVDMNSAAQELTQRPAVELVGEPLQAALAAWPELVRRLREATEGNVAFSAKLEGEDRHFDVTFSALRDPGGTLRGRVIVCHDVTRLARAEAELQRRNELLSDANRELDAFSHSVSHDLRAPLRAIESFARIAREERQAGRDERTDEYLARVQRNAEHMQRLTLDLLEFAKLGQNRPAKRPVRVDELAREILDELKPELLGRTLDVRIRELPEAHGDPALVRRVLANLLGNAVKFTRRTESPEVEVGYREESGQGAYFVRDNGAGFDPRYRERLFGLFQRLHSANEFEGTGVGLAVANRIVHRHGGRIWAESEVGRGATFYFTLP